MNKKELVWKSLKRTPKVPYGWIQWKGTEGCVDLTCICGEGFHFDGDFMYFIQCPYCKRYFECGGYIKLYEVNEPDKERVSIKYPTKE